MGCLVSSALCCAGAMCCSCLCSPCRRAGVPDKNFAKIGYVFFQIAWIGIALLLMITAKDLVDWFPKGMLDCPS